MSEVKAEVSTHTVEVKDKAPAEIIRGRMPVVLVWAMRFGDISKDLSASKLAAMFGTTVGKVNDVLKNSNFAYVTETFKPSQEQIDLGIAHLKRHPKYDTGEVDPLIEFIDHLEKGSEEEIAAFAAISKRAPQTLTKDGEVANAGGGNRRGKAKKDAKEAQAEQGEEVPASTAEALLD